MSGPDEATKATVQKLPLLTVKAGPRDGDDWIARVKEEYMALIQVRTRSCHAPLSSAPRAPVS